jgi:aminoglycoside phosphotransferase (APT) family kinase protein
MSWPSADLTIDESLLRSQFPHLSELERYPVAEGFDNSLWRLSEDLALRIPRRAAAVELMMNELRWLSVIARHVSLRTPLPIVAGVPSDGYPWPWAITSWIDGIPGDEIDLDSNGASASAPATFLCEIHVEAPIEAPRNPVRGVALSARSSTFNERLTRVRAIVDDEPVMELWKVCVTAPLWSSPPRWLPATFIPPTLCIAMASSSVSSTLATCAPAIPRPTSRVV